AGTTSLAAFLCVEDPNLLEPDLSAMGTAVGTALRRVMCRPGFCLSRADRERSFSASRRRLTARPPAPPRPRYRLAGCVGPGSPASRKTGRAASRARQDQNHLPGR